MSAAAVSAVTVRGHRLRHRHHVHYSDGERELPQPRVEGLQLGVATDRRFFAHRGFRRLGSSSDDLKVSDAAAAKTKGGRGRRLNRARSEAGERQGDREKRRFLSLSGKSSVRLEDGISVETADRQKRSKLPRPIETMSPLDDLFSTPQPPVRVSRELRSSLLDYENSGLLLQSFWLPEANPLGDETKADKDQCAPLYRRRDLDQLTGGDGNRAAAVRGTSGCVISGQVSGSSAMVGQNGRRLNLRAAWSDTPELKAQRQLSYHSLRLAGQPAETGVHLSWAAQLRDPAVKIMESSSSASLQPGQMANAKQQQQQRKQAEEDSSDTAEVLAKVRAGSGTARSPLKASAVFHARRFSRALSNRFLSVEGQQTGLPVQLGDLLLCLQQQQQQQEHHHEQQQQQQLLPKLQRRQVAQSDAPKAELQSQQQQPPPPSMSESEAPKQSKQRRKKAKFATTSGRIATGRSLSKSAPATRSSTAGAASFIPIVTQLSTAASGVARRHAATRREVTQNAKIISHETGRLAINHIGESDRDASPTSNPPPSTPKGEAETEDFVSTDFPGPGDDGAGEILRVPVMPPELDEAEEPEDCDDEAPVNFSRVSLTSTHVTERRDEED